MNRTHIIKLYPTIKQKKSLYISCNVARFAYNWGLARWQSYYQSGIKTSAYQIKKDFRKLRFLLNWIDKAGKSTFEKAFDNVEKAYKNFFKNNKFGYPKFKKKNKCRNSFYVANDRIRFYDKKITIPKIGRVKMSEYLRFNGKILNATVFEKNKKWYIAITVELPDVKSKEIKSVVGIDLGINKTLTLSNGKIYNYPNIIKETKKLKRLQKSFSRKMKRSNQYYKNKLLIGKQYEKITNILNDFLHKITSKICNENQIIAMENLNVKGMIKNKHLSHALIMQRFNKIIDFFKYKAQHFLQVDRFFPSTKKCANCNKINDMKLNNRIYKCECGYINDRDSNAAINIVGQALSESTLVDKKALANLYNKFVKPCLIEARTKPCSLMSTC